MTPIIEDAFFLNECKEIKVNESKGTIIILNGTSSVGKSTLASQISKKLKDSVIVRCDEVAVDVFKNLVNKKNYTISENTPKDLLSLIYKGVPDIDPNFLDDEINKEMYERIRSAASQGKIVINDNAWIQQKDAENCEEELKGFSVICIFVHSSLNDLLVRVKKRNEQSSEIEHRVMTLPFQTISLMYRTVNKENECIVDTWKAQSVREFMDHLQKEFETIKHLYNSYWVEEATSFFSSLQEFYDHFKISNENSVPVTSKFPFDYLINTSKSTLEECTQQVVHWLKK